VKPGRHNFTIEHDQGGAILDETQHYEKRLGNFMAEKMRKGAKNDKNFYVHEMLATFRNDSIPTAFKARHTTQVTKKLFKPKPVFKSWQ
jgi:hypothetical protein